MGDCLWAGKPPRYQWRNNRACSARGPGTVGAQNLVNVYNPSAPGNQHFCELLPRAKFARRCFLQFFGGEEGALLEYLHAGPLQPCYATARYGRYVHKPTRSTQPCILLGSLNRVPALIGWGKGGNVTSAGWQVILCDPTWHASSRRGVVVVAQTAIRFFTLSYLTYPV